ncbi:hypothetical protein [Peribacillus kribbensis]|uniref:hypothetical protein n=1 Tax=Peribacillus kribbensis TaxID=356658 RepID=UPI0003F92BFC|nr:hypothetical protein [Peribacillus kribbensis]
MRFSEKGRISTSGANQVFGVDFHDFMQKEESSTVMELASEFGLDVREVKNLKKRMER